MSSDEVLTELNALVRDQLNALEQARYRSFTESEQYAWRNARIKTLLEHLEREAA